MSLAAEDDLALVARIRSGDPTAIAELALRYRTSLERFARSMLADDHAAEDVAQETLARLKQQLLPVGPPRPWLYRIARNLCLDRLRHNKASPTFGGRLRTGFDAPKNSAGPATRLGKAERDARVHSVLDQMPPEYRDVLLLKHFDDLSREEIAAVLDISEAAVKGRLVRGAEYLRDQLRGLSGGA